MVEEDLSQIIQDNASGPASVEADGVRAQQHRLTDQIEADKYLAAKRGRTNPLKAFVRVKIVPPGAV